jgi:hypothetical protein
MNGAPEYGESDYLRAQRMGQKKYDCTEYHLGCPMSIFEVGLFTNRKNTHQEFAINLLVKLKAALNLHIKIELDFL